CGILLIFFRKFRGLQRAISLLGVLGTAAVSWAILQKIQSDGILRLDFGGWLPPYGILFVADSFATLLVFTASVVTAIILLYAFGTVGHRTEKMFFYPFTLILLAGVNGSFLTGDLFNLFVCFEVMLLASYVLITLGGRAVQLRE